jgi:hypothetical protein
MVQLEFGSLCSVVAADAPQVLDDLYLHEGRGYERCRDSGYWRGDTWVDTEGLPVKVILL